METFLNLSWVALSIVMVWAWLRNEDGTDRKHKMVALAVLIAILLPAISISDDLLAMQNATETDTSVRRQQLNPNGAHPLVPKIDGTHPPALHSGIVVADLGIVPLPAGIVAHFDIAGLPTIQNRPPPAA